MARAAAGAAGLPMAAATTVVCLATGPCALAVRNGAAGLLATGAAAWVALAFAGGAAAFCAGTDVALPPVEETAAAVAALGTAALGGLGLAGTALAFGGAALRFEYTFQRSFRSVGF